MNGLDGYRVQLDVFTGPLDLLLYLIRRDEIDIHDIPIAHITEQYIAQVRLLEHLDPDAAGEFLVLAATLIELKSRALLPSPPVALGEEPEDPRAPLVRQLLEYKRFKDAARALGSAADERARRFVRRPADLPPQLRGVELEEAQVWDLLEAFGRVMAGIGRGPTVHRITDDDTPIELHSAEIIAILEREGPTTFEALFDGPPNRLHIVGRFLALLELIRTHRIRAEQERAFGTIYLFLLEKVPEEAWPADPAADAPDGAAPAEPVAGPGGSSPAVASAGGRRSAATARSEAAADGPAHLRGETSVCEQRAAGRADAAASPSAPVARNPEPEPCPDPASDSRPSS